MILSASAPVIEIGFQGGIRDIFWKTIETSQKGAPENIHQAYSQASAIVRLCISAIGLVELATLPKTIQTSLILEEHWSIHCVFSWILTQYPELHLFTW